MGSRNEDAVLWTTLNLSNLKGKEPVCFHSVMGVMPVVLSFATSTTRVVSSPGQGHRYNKVSTKRLVRLVRLEGACASA